jgi:hypothetical protein
MVEEEKKVFEKKKREKVKNREVFFWRVSTKREQDERWI